MPEYVTQPAVPIANALLTSSVFGVATAPGCRACGCCGCICCCCCADASAGCVGFSSAAAGAGVGAGALSLRDREAIDGGCGEGSGDTSDTSMEPAGTEQNSSLSR